MSGYAWFAQARRLRSWVITEDDFDQAVQDAADLELCRELLSRMEPLDPAQAEAEHAETVAFLEGIASRTSRA